MHGEDRLESRLTAELAAHIRPDRIGAVLHRRTTALDDRSLLELAQTHGLGVAVATIREMFAWHRANDPEPCCQIERRGRTGRCAACGRLSGERA